jgi:hypothetical protein
MSNDFTVDRGPPDGSFPTGLTSWLTWPVRPLRSDPITGPSSLLRVGPPLCSTSLNDLGATGSPVPCQCLRRAHATYTPGTARATCRPLPGSQPAPSRARLYPRAQVPPWFRCRLHISMRPQWFTHVRLLVAHLTRSWRAVSATLTTPALDRRSLRWFGISACTANPEGQPPSPAQHTSRQRPSTSSTLRFQDTPPDRCLLLRRWLCCKNHCRSWVKAPVSMSGPLADRRFWA